MNLLNLIDECNLTHLHIFPYLSKKINTSSTYATSFQTILLKHRAKTLRDHGKKCLSKYLKKQIGSIEIYYACGKILIQLGSLGKSQHFTKIQIRPSAT